MLNSGFGLVLCRLVIGLCWILTLISVLLLSQLLSVAAVTARVVRTFVRVFSPEVDRLSSCLRRVFLDRWDGLAGFLGKHLRHVRGVRLFATGPGGFGLSFP